MQNNSNKTLLNTVRFENGIPIRGMFRITEWCVLGDCSQPECHHCFPVVNCTKHKLCIVFVLPTILDLIIGLYVF